MVTSSALAGHLVTGPSLGPPSSLRLGFIAISCRESWLRKGAQRPTTELCLQFEEPDWRKELWL